MEKTWKWQTAMALALAVCGMAPANANAENATAVTPVPPPLSYPRSLYFKAHPDARKAFLAGLAQRRPGASPSTHRVVKLAGGTWHTVTAATASVGLSSPQLLTDGTVIAQNANASEWYKLTPDINGNYATGTWTKIASLPKIGGVQYAPLYHSSAVLPDGRVIIMGGEYNGSNTEKWTSLGAIYDPVANSWTAVGAPSSWTQIGDAESTVLANGTYLQASCCANPDADALLDAATLTWTATGAPTGLGTPYQDEQGYELLPNGNVLTIDVWSQYNVQGNPTNAEQYTPSTGLWTSAGTMPVSLVDPYACGNFEIGPAVLRANNTLVGFGGNTGCVSGATADPTAILNTAKMTWTKGPKVPALCGTNSTTSCTLADAPAALLPNGNILFAASAGYGQSPTHFFEFTTGNKINQVSDTVDYASSSGSYYYNFLVLPNGQILETDFSNIAEVYSPLAGVTTNTKPVISTAPASVSPGTLYPISGQRFSGRSQGAYYGDDAQMATNYPIVRITNTATGHVFYGRTTQISNFSVAATAKCSAQFTVPTGIETGASTLVVIANGVPSAPKNITVN